MFALALLAGITGPACAQGGQPAPAPLLSEGFESHEAGPFTQLEFAGHTWLAPEGHAAVHTQHKRTGRQALRLNGGAERGVELRLGEELDEAIQLDFWAERWTQQTPFQFRVHGRVNGRWRELYNGDDTIAVGGFRTHVRVPLPEGTDRVRLISTTPDDAGVLIDDMRIAQAAPMRIKSIDTTQLVSPALVGNRTNPIALIVIETEGAMDPVTLEQVHINTAGTTDLDDIEGVEVYYTGTNRQLDKDFPDRSFPIEARFGRAQRPGAELTFRDELQLAEGVNYLWVSYTLKPDADIDGRADAGCAWVRLDNSQDQIVPDTINPEGSQRLGLALRNANMDGIRAYRIPGLATTNEGTLIAVYDNRNRGWGDLPGDIDVGMSRSTDGGRTWEPMKIIMDMGNEGGAGLRGNGIGDPAVLVDRATNTIWVAGLWSYGNRGWHGSGPGLAPEETGQFILVKSEDDGRTWSRPINITEQVKHPGWHLMLQGPGKGITLSDGTIMFPAQYRDTAANGQLPLSTVIYSKDHGETWSVGTGAFLDTTEAQVVELEDGLLMLNSRYNRQNRRVVMTSSDLGATWEEHPTTRNALTEPGSCMASLINVDRELGRPYTGVLLFSNPASPRARQEMTIRASIDGGMTWPEDMAILLDHGLSAGYSCMTMIDDEYVGILYEGNRAHMTFQRIPLAELIHQETE
ncbi:MAG: exo-alpha-sialidase [Phycisphaerales bacterium JB063]